MSRKDILRVPQPKASASSSSERPVMSRVRPMLGTEAPPPASQRLTTQVGSNLNDINHRLDHAREIEKRLAEGQAVVDINPAAIDPSFVRDRMDGDIDGLLESIRAQGQQVPILVRPHPEASGRYQVAFGHRRLQALKELGLQARAIVRELTDEQLVVAQGQENNERQDLTFIEKARFATRLREKFSREVITSSMSIDKGNLSKMFSIVDTIPAELIDAIGPAPGIGQPNWQKMADFIIGSSNADGVTEYARSRTIQSMPSSDRFKAILAMKSPKRPKALPTLMSTSNGARLAEIAQSKVKLDISIDKRAAPEFAAFILGHVPALFEEHLAKQKLKTGE